MCMCVREFVDVSACVCVCASVCVRVRVRVGGECVRVYLMQELLL